MTQLIFIDQQINSKLSLLNSEPLKQELLLFMDYLLYKEVDQNGSVFADPRDGQKYPYKKIGTQVWMTKNLNFKMNESYCYGNNNSIGETYGRLYTWEAALKAAPQGWHLPSDEEWETLTNYIISQKRESKIGFYLKADFGWRKNFTGNDFFGFQCLPAGFRHNNATYHNFEENGYWWSSSGREENYINYAWYRGLSYRNSSWYRGYNDKLSSFSLRVLKD